MILFGLLLHLLGCSAVEAQETPLPAGASNLRSTLQSFLALRMWVVGAEDAYSWGGQAPPFGSKFILSIRNDGVVIIDTNGRNTRFRWGDGVAMVDGAAKNSHDPLTHPERHAPREQKHWRYTVPLVQLTVLTLRSQDSQWFPRGPAYYQWASLSPQDVEVILPGFDTGGYHLFVHYTVDGQPSRLVAQRSQSERFTLWIRRLEINPNLPADWFGPDAPEFNTRFPEFEDGEPTPPLDPGFYAPSSQPPPPPGGNPPPQTEPPPGGTPPPPPEPPPGG